MLSEEDRGMTKKRKIVAAIFAVVAVVEITLTTAMWSQVGVGLIGYISAFLFYGIANTVVWAVMDDELKRMED